MMVPLDGKWIMTDQLSLDWQEEIAVHLSHEEKNLAKNIHATELQYHQSSTLWAYQRTCFDCKFSIHWPKSAEWNLTHSVIGCDREFEGHTLMRVYRKPKVGHLCFPGEDFTTAWIIFFCR